MGMPFRGNFLAIDDYERNVMRQEAKIIIDHGIQQIEDWPGLLKSIKPKTFLQVAELNLTKIGKSNWCRQWKNWRIFEFSTAYFADNQQESKKKTEFQNWINEHFNRNPDIITFEHKDQLFWAYPYHLHHSLVEFLLIFQDEIMKFDELVIKTNTFMQSGQKIKTHLAALYHQLVQVHHKSIKEIQLIRAKSTDIENEEDDNVELLKLKLDSESLYKKLRKSLHLSLNEFVSTIEEPQESK